MGTLMISLHLLACLWPVIEPNIIPQKEAAFQGRCEDGNPCAQVCFNIHNDMFECECTPGYDLSDNGYSCTESSAVNASTVPSQPSTQATISDQPFPAGTAVPSYGLSSPLAIQIEVDIDPPPSNSGGVSDAKLEALGLPTHHVHFTAASSKQAQPRVSAEELLAPEDIKITYSEGDNSSSQSFIVEPHKERDEPKPALPVQSAAYGNYEAWNKMYGDEKASYIQQEGPRVLPSTEREFIITDKDKIPTTKEEEKNDEISNLSNKDDSTYSDRVFSVDVFCNLDCGNEGDCFMERQPQTGDIKKRCLCPVGKTGKNCADDELITWPHFSGQSYFSLPTLTNAYSDLQLSLEFKSESSNGIILLTGETSDMTGDYLTLLLRDGRVELRLDCGTGPGIVRSTSRANIGQWNRLTVFRHDWGVWLQLNGGPHDEGRSQGLFSRLTFAQPVTLGGIGHFTNTDHFLEMDAGYIGCIRNLEINNKMYNFSPFENGGDIIQGRDIGQCSSVEEDCQSIRCQHQGICALGQVGSDSNIEAVCQCPLGYEGKFCENAIEIEVPSFEGGDDLTSSHLRYAGIGEGSPLWNEFELVIRPTKKDGLILYNGNANGDDFDGESDDFIAIFLNNGFVEFAFNAGDGVTLVRSHSPVNMGSWHSVLVSRTGLLSEVAVDSQKRMIQLGAGSFTQVSLRQHLYLGGVPSFDMISPLVPIRKSFSGCIQKVSINNAILPLIHSAIGGMNVGRCMSHPCTTKIGAEPPCGLEGTCRPVRDNFTCECPLGRIGARCEMSLDLDANETSSSESISVPYFGGDSFLQFHDEGIAKNIIGNTNSFNIRAKIFSSDGLILWSGGDHVQPSSDYLLLGVRKGHLEFRFNLGNGEGSLVYNLTKINDGKWHRIRATRTEQTASLKVDNGHIITGASPGKLRQLNGNGHLFIGGAEELEHLPVPEFRFGLVGCIGQLSVGQIFEVDLMHRAKNGRNIDSCQEESDPQTLLLSIP